jgi:hypothetical protein
MQLNEIGRFISLLETQKNTGLIIHVLINVVKGLLREQESIFGDTKQISFLFI